MATKNLGNVVGLIKSPTPPAKTFVLWAKQLNPVLNPDLVELHYYNGTAWVPLTGGGSEPMINTTYDELRTLIDTNSLIPGQQYRITDYITTVREDLDWAISAQHQFDIIVIADSVNTLNAKARAVRTEEDSYFPEYTRFEVWELMYSIDNNVNLYDWADPENGKGVIYYMKDEFNNELSYDFKSIKFKRCQITGVSSALSDVLINTYRGIPPSIRGENYGIDVANDIYLFFYTFHNIESDTEVSVSLMNSYQRNFYGNIIKPNIYHTEADNLVYNTYVLNNNVFVGTSNRISNNIFGQDVQHNTFGHFFLDNHVQGNMCFCIFYSLNDCNFESDIRFLIILYNTIETPISMKGINIGKSVNKIVVQNNFNYFIEIKCGVTGGVNHLDVINKVNGGFGYIPKVVTIYKSVTGTVFESIIDANSIERFDA